MGMVTDKAELEAIACRVLKQRTIPDHQTYQTVLSIAPYRYLVWRLERP